MHSSKTRTRQNNFTVKRYRVVAYYDYPPLERTAELEANDPRQAMVRALIERHVPAAFLHDEFGWLQPVLWSPDLAGPGRWPVFINHRTLAWAERQRNQRVSFSVTELLE